MTIQPGAHIEHEAVAFNFAVGVALLWVAARPVKARTQLPVLLSFAAVLTVLSIVDIIGGGVGWYRLASHFPLLLGVVCTVLIGARDWRWPWPGDRASAEPQHRAEIGTRFDEVSPERPARERRPPAARRHVA
jgi:predicted anti-sigma-YlaC factor YlaD